MRKKSDVLKKRNLLENMISGFLNMSQKLKKNPKVNIWLIPKLIFF